MYYLKIELPANGSIRPNIIEVTNSWTGIESIFVNGILVSKKGSFFGTHHYFTLTEFGRPTRYTLTTKFAMNQYGVAIDLSRNGIKIKENIPVPYGKKPSNPTSNIKKGAMKKLKDFDLEGALLDFEYALEKNSSDGEIYFHMACAYSILERTEEGFYALAKSVDLGYANNDTILNHDMLAYLRMNEAFEDFLNSGFQEYDVLLVRIKEEEFV